MAGKNILVSF